MKLRKQHRGSRIDHCRALGNQDSHETNPGPGNSLPTVLAPQIDNPNNGPRSDLFGRQTLVSQRATLWVHLRQQKFPIGR